MSKPAREGDWIQTYTGRQFWPVDPRPEDIDIEDIAHALSMLCRYGGHCLRFYSVAEHSVLMARHVDSRHAMSALLHDASEAFLVDVPRPIKGSLIGYREAEARIERAVAARFGIPATMPDAVKDADYRILTDECRQNMAAPPAKWSTEAEPLGVHLQYWAPHEAAVEFMSEYRRLIERPSP